MRQLPILLFAPLLGAATMPAGILEVEVRGLRNANGLVHACLTRNQKHFPDCRADPAAITATVEAGAPAIRFAGFAPGTYALTLFHDENRNRKLDTMLGIPREGFGFSRNPVVRFGPPKFNQVDVALPAGFTRHTVRMQYLL